MKRTVLTSYLSGGLEDCAVHERRGSGLQRIIACRQGWDTSISSFLFAGLTVYTSIIAVPSVSLRQFSPMSVSQFPLFRSMSLVVL